MTYKATLPILAGLFAAGLLTAPSAHASGIGAAIDVHGGLNTAAPAHALVFKGGVDPRARKRRHARIRALLFGPKGKRK